MPMYAGKGNILSRMNRAARSKSRGEMWEHFSWFIISDPELWNDIEVLLLRVLTPSLRILTK